VQTAADELRELQRDVTELDQLRREIGEYFCEDETTFKLDDCIKTFSTFFDHFHKAIEVSKQTKHLLFMSLRVFGNKTVLGLYCVKFLT